jgi:hypothetical protein
MVLNDTKGTIGTINREVQSAIGTVHSSVGTIIAHKQDPITGGYCSSPVMRRKEQVQQHLSNLSVP